MRNIIAALILLFLSGLQVAPAVSTAGDDKDGAKRTKFLNELTPDEYFTVRGQPDMRYVLLMPEGMSLTPARESKQYKEERELVLVLTGYVENEKSAPQLDATRDTQKYCWPQAVFCILIPSPKSAPPSTVEFLKAVSKDIKARKIFTPSRILLHAEGFSCQSTLTAILAHDVPFHGAYINMADDSPPLSLEGISFPSERVLRTRRITFMHMGAKKVEATIAVAEKLQAKGVPIYPQWYTEVVIRDGKRFIIGPNPRHITEGFTFIASTEEGRR